MNPKLRGRLVVGVALVVVSGVSVLAGVWIATHYVFDYYRRVEAGAQSDALALEKVGERYILKVSELEGAGYKFVGGVEDRARNKVTLVWQQPEGTWGFRQCWMPNSIVITRAIPDNVVFTDASGTTRTVEAQPGF